MSSRSQENLKLSARDLLYCRGRNTHTTHHTPLQTNHPTPPQHTTDYMHPHPTPPRLWALPPVASAEA